MSPVRLNASGVNPKRMSLTGYPLYANCTIIHRLVEGLLTLMPRVTKNLHVAECSRAPRSRCICAAWSMKSG